MSDLIPWLFERPSHEVNLTSEQISYLKAELTYWRPDFLQLKRGGKKFLQAVIAYNERSAANESSCARETAASRQSAEKTGTKKKDGKRKDASNDGTQPRKQGMDGSRVERASRLLR